MKFTMEQFFNDFGSGFVLLSGLAFTNRNSIFNNEMYFSFIANLNIIDSVLILIMVLIVGLVLSAISNFIDQDLYNNIDAIIRKTYFKKPVTATQKFITIFINKPLFFIKYITIFTFFRRWTYIETVMLLNKKISKLRKKGKKLPRGLEFVEGKDTEEIFIIEKMLNRKIGSFGMHYWYKSQFWQMFGNAIFSIFILNLLAFKSIDFISLTTIIYAGIFFLSKSMSPMYSRMYLRQISREVIAIKQLEKK